jgi:hypothetical protein
MPGGGLAGEAGTGAGGLRPAHPASAASIAAAATRNAGRALPRPTIPNIRTSPKIAGS